MNWADVQRVATAQLVEAVREVRRQRPEAVIYGAAFHEFHGDGESIGWPVVAVGTEDELAAAASRFTPGEAGDVVSGLRWSGVDMPVQCYPDDEAQAWAEAVHDYGTRNSDAAQWDSAYDRFLRVFPRAAKAARAELVAEGTVGTEFIAVALDEAMELVTLSLTAGQVRRYFPHLDAAEVERRRLDALPPDEAVASLLDHSADGTSPLTEKEIADRLVASGTAAVPQLVDAFVVADDWGTAQILMRMQSLPSSAMSTLEAAMIDDSANVYKRNWAAKVLGTHAMDAVVAHAETLPEEVLMSGITGPYDSLAAEDRPLDYAPLESALLAIPEWEREILSAIGSGTREIRRSDLPVAFAGLSSPWPAVRRHAIRVLAFSDLLNKTDRTIFLQGMAELESSDPSPVIRNGARRAREHLQPTPGR